MAIPMRALRSKANPGSRDWPVICSKNSGFIHQTCSKICRMQCLLFQNQTAAAMVVVHRPRLSPTADCVTLLVRTILFEMR